MIASPHNYQNVLIKEIFVIKKQSQRRKSCYHTITRRCFARVAIYLATFNHDSVKTIETIASSTVTAL